MRIFQSVFAYLLLFLTLSLMLKLLGFLEISLGEIVGYGLIFYGISIVYLAFGRGHRISLFIGAVFFLIGIVLFIVNNFIIFWNIQLFYPVALFIAGIAFIMLFLDDMSKKKPFIIGTVLIFTGMIISIFSGHFNLQLFNESLLNVAVSYWPVALIVAGILFLIWVEERNQ